MLRGVWGKKIGMTQLFSNDKAVPVTVIDLGRWIITQIKTAEQDGYTAVQVGLVKDAFTDKPFDTVWLKKLKNYFSSTREIKVSDLSDEYIVGNDIDYASAIKAGDNVNVSGISKGRGFAGAVKRHGFSGGSASHGPRLGRRPGSVGFMRSQGRVIKGKRLPGHFGTTQHTLEKLNIVSFQPEMRMIMVKGGVPGGKGSLLYLHKV